MEKRKILFVINSLGIGGAEQSLLSLLSLLDYEKYQVDLQLLSFGGVFEPLLPKQVHVLPGLDYMEFSRMPLAKQLLSFRLGYLAARFRTAYSLRHNARTGNKLHSTQAYWKGCGKVHARLAERYDVAVAWGQGTPTHYVSEKVTAQRKYAWVNANYQATGHNKDFDLEIYGRYDKVVCVSTDLTKLFQGVFPEYRDRVITIRDIRSPQQILGMAQEQISLPVQAQVTIVSVGRLTWQKGFTLAVEAAALLRQRGVDFVWYIVGEGGERPALEEKIRTLQLHDRVILLGAKANPYPYIRAADIYVQTSKTEGYCLALAEARMLEIPCVTTDFDVVYEQMVDGENGLVVSMTAQSVADGVQRLIDDPVLYDHIRQYQHQEKNGSTEEVEKVDWLLEGAYGPKD